MASFNQVAIAGNLTRDVELKHTQGGLAIAKLGLAINERVKKGEAWEDKAVFVDVTLFGRTAEVAGEYLTKGAPVLIGGKLELQEWEDKNGGGKRSKLAVVGEKLTMLGSPNKGGQHSQAGRTEDEYSQAPAKAPAGPTPTDDIPFAFIGFLLSFAMIGGMA